MAGIRAGPLPSKSVLLSDLPTFAPGDKIRFLGCVTSYSAAAAILTLEHNHPTGNKLKALVDVKLLLENLKSFETRVGEWVNIIGYIMTPRSDTRSRTSIRPTVFVQAIMLWSSGPLKLQNYEICLDQQKADNATIQTIT